MLVPRILKSIKRNSLEVISREKSFVKRAKLTENVISLLDQIQNNLLNRAKKLMEDNITKTASYDILKSTVQNKGGFVFTGWCGDEQCEDKIKEETGADIRVIPFEGQQESKTTMCVYCHQPAKKIAIFARAY